MLLIAFSPFHDQKKTKKTSSGLLGVIRLCVCLDSQGYLLNLQTRFIQRVEHLQQSPEGDIIPGSVVVSLRINADGLLENMELVRRRGASMIQQSFTFGAIRNASLPPMPSQVRREMHGDLLELIFTFNFD